MVTTSEEAPAASENRAGTCEVPGTLWEEAGGRSQRAAVRDTPVRETEEPRTVLLVGQAPTLLWAIPHLMGRCGFTVDVVATSPLLKASRFVRELIVVPEAESLTAVAFAHICDRQRPYDWVVACDDLTLFQMSGLEWPSDREPALLPLRTSGRRPHIFSKIGLSRVLDEAGVRTPAFRVAENCVEAVAAGRELGYPVMVKTDADSCGAGVHLCRSDDDVWQLDELFARGPMLVQKKIEGREVCLSGLFFEGQLIHFSCAEAERLIAGNSLSAVRKYWPLQLLDEAVFYELNALGRALDASGFVSISCMDAADGSGRYFFEADMRPNVWSDTSRLFGDDAAPRIQRWFERGQVLSLADMRMAGSGEPVRVAHFQRLHLWELLVNRYGVWSTVPRLEWRLIAALLWARLYMPAVRALLPKRVRRAIKRSMMALRIAFP